MNDLHNRQGSPQHADSGKAEGDVIDRLRQGSLVIVSAIVLCACAKVPPAPPIPAALVEPAEIPGFTDIRRWGDRPLPEHVHPSAAERATQDGTAPETAKPRLKVLAISGGGSNGAFAAGLLTGLTLAGARPTFHIVTGVSVGALAAPFAFLGPTHDEELRELFATLSSEDIVAPRPYILAPFSDALASPTPLESLVAKHFDERLLNAVAAEHRKGRRLFVSTTHVYAGRQVIWDIGAIAASAQPGALDLIRRVLLASASVPTLLPPVYIEVEAAGKRYSEMHVDGGIMHQVFVAPPDFDWEAASRALGTDRHADFYVIRNGRARSEYMVMEPRAIALGEHAVHQLSQSLGIGDLYMIFVRAERERGTFRAAWIGDDFAAPWTGWYDADYTRALFEYGRMQALSGNAWHSLPPGL